MLSLKFDKKNSSKYHFSFVVSCIFSCLATSPCWTTGITWALREDKLNLCKFSSGIIQWYPYLKWSGQEVPCKTRFLPEGSSQTQRKRSSLGSCLSTTWALLPQHPQGFNNEPELRSLSSITWQRDQIPVLRLVIKEGGFCK